MRARGGGEDRGTPTLLSPALPPVPEEEPPSCALASVVQHLPLELMDGVVRNLSNDDSVTDSQMLTAVSRLVRSLCLPEAPSSGWVAGLDLVFKGPHPHAYSFIHLFSSSALCLAQGWMWETQRALP